MFVVYNTETTRIETEKRWGKESYKTEAAAKAARTRMLRKLKMGKPIWKPEDLAVADVVVYRTLIEKMVKRVNMMSGKEYYESVNTPNYCSPASESYWSM